LRACTSRAQGPSCAGKGIRPGFGIPRWWTRIHKPSFWFYRHGETSRCGSLARSLRAPRATKHVNRGLRLVHRMQYSQNII
jgi:hypothetical protein